ncbi:MAG: CCA tRNA nucleotidyltransferase [Candidatus Altiarchaeales archaeon ex4484_2]|nr:MAG: CCA tRNA nucleotidyltransferase [Candidatus Altiarchaeales archaeon ex4484_2]
MDELLKSMLEEIKPTKEERTREKRIIGEVKGELEKLGMESLLVGSLAKETDLRADKDIDLFILFDESVSRETLEEEGVEAGKKAFDSLNAKYEIDYAEHPYVVGFYGGYDVDVVPCYKVDMEHIKSAVDRTPHHTNYIKRKLRQDRGLRDEILLLKQFMKGIRVYGAETKTQGFSGYLVELLVLNYGSFRGVLEAAVDWHFGEILDPEDSWASRQEIRCLFPESDLVIIDPVDRYRNAAAAVSRQRIALFKFKAERFLEKPGREYFFPPDRTAPPIPKIKGAMESRGTRFLLMEFNHPAINVNSLHSQLRKTLKATELLMEERGFRFVKSGYWTNEVNLSIILFELEVHALPVIEKRLGPPADKKGGDQKRFRDKYGKTYLEDGRWMADAEREYKTARQLIEKITAERRGFGRNLREEAKVEIKEGVEVLELRDKSYLLFLKDFLLI